MAGFTLIESLLVLLVVMSLLYYPIQQWHRWQEELVVEDFFQLFELHLVSAQFSSISYHKRASALVVRGESYITFFYQRNGQDSEKETILLTIPIELEVVKNTTLHYIGRTGNVSEIVNFKFKQQSNDRVYIYQFYLGSGRFVKKIE